MIADANSADTEPQLTDGKRLWLASERGTMTFSLLVTAFISTFGLTPEQAGKLIAQWVREGK